MKYFRKTILLLTVVAIGLAGSSIATVNLHKGEDVREENTFTRPPVQHERPALVETTAPVVENYVEVVETTTPVTESPINDVPELVEPDYTEEQHEILAIVIYQESGADYFSDDTRRKVGSVFINRVNSPLFPNTFEEVATAESQYGRLYWTGLKWPDRASNPGEAHAVERAYRIAEELLTNGSILPDNVIWQAEFIQGDGIYCEQDGFYFCYSEVDK